MGDEAVGIAWRALAWLVVLARWLVVAAWLAGSVWVAVALPGLGTQASLAGLEPPDSQATQTELRSARLFGGPLSTRAAVVQRDPRGLSPAAQGRALARAEVLHARPDRALPDLRGVVPLLNTGRIVPGSRESGTTAISYLLLAPDASIERQDATAHAFARRHVDRPDDALVGVTGSSPARARQWQAIRDALPLVTVATVALIALIVGLHFRSLVAPAVTLTAAGVGYVMATHLAGWLGRRQGLAVPQEVEPVMVVLLLGVVTDYTIFFLAGAHRRLAAGEPRLRAAQGSAAANAPIVFTAGIIVAAGTATLVLGDSNFFRAFGPGLAVTALVAMVVALTFVPAALAILGRVAFWPGAVRERGRPEGRGVRYRAVHLMTARPVALVIALVCTAGLLWAATGLARTELGFPLAQDLPGDSEPARAAAAAGRGFAPGVLAPTTVLVERARIARRTAELERFQDLIGREPEVGAVLGPGDAVARRLGGAVLSRDGGAARFAVVLGVEPLGHRGIHAVGRLDQDLPGLLRRSGLQDARASVSGDTALARETIDGMLGDLVRIAVAALAVNFLVLAIFLRSLVAPLPLLLASALALAAALGLTTLVFERWLDVDELAYYVPFATAVLLTALGSDYNVFVVGRVWQEAADAPLREAIARATPRAARAITVAGVTLALSFAMLAIVPLRSFREFAFTMSVGVLLETFLVRSALVPALLSIVRPKARRRPRAPVTPPATS